VGVAEKQMFALNLSIKRPPGHASMPPKENANFILSEALARVAAYTTPENLTPVAKEMENRLGGLEQTVYNNAVRRNTISLTVLKGFVGDPPKTNVIPEHSEAVLDCRLLPEQDKDEFLKELKNVIDDDRITITPVLEPKWGSVVSPYDSELFRIIEEETAKAYPNSITLPHLVIYGTDSRYFREKGASCYGFFPGPVSMEEYSRIHGNDERIRLESLSKATDIYCSVVKQFCEKR
jgi:carboxypeptidase PM20D1